MANPHIIEEEPLRFVGMHPDSAFDPGTQTWDEYSANGKSCFYRRISSGMVAVCDQVGEPETVLSWAQFMEMMDELSEVAKTEAAPNMGNE